MYGFVRNPSPNLWKADVAVWQILHYYVKHVRKFLNIVRIKSAKKKDYVVVNNHMTQVWPPSLVVEMLKPHHALVAIIVPAKRFEKLDLVLKSQKSFRYPW